MITIDSSNQFLLFQVSFSENQILTVDDSTYINITLSYAEFSFSLIGSGTIFGILIIEYTKCLTIIYQILESTNTPDDLLKIPMNLLSDQHHITQQQPYVLPDCIFKCCSLLNLLYRNYCIISSMIDTQPDHRITANLIKRESLTPETETA